MKRNPVKLNVCSGYSVRTCQTLLIIHFTIVWERASMVKVLLKKRPECY